MNNNKIKNYITDHLYGRHSLKRTFWINCILLGFVWGSIIELIYIGLIKFLNLDPTNTVAYINILIFKLIISSIFIIYTNIGLWRSAGFYTKQHSPKYYIFGWGRIVRFLVILQYIFIIIGGIFSIIMSYVNYLMTTNKIG